MGAPNLPILNFDQLEDSVSPPPHLMETLPTPHLANKVTTTSVEVPSKECNIAIFNQLLTLKVKFTLREVYDYLHTCLDETRRLQTILAKKVEFSLEELLKLNIQSWNDVLQRVNGSFLDGYGGQVPSHSPHINIVHQRPLTSVEPTSKVRTQASPYRCVSTILHVLPS